MYPVAAVRGRNCQAGGAEAPLPGPDEYENLDLWLSMASDFYQDNERTTPVAASGDKVGGWDDISGSDDHWLQSTDGSRPEYQENVMAGQPGVYFDGKDLRSGTDYGQTVTWFFVIRPNIAANGGVNNLFDTAPFSGSTLRNLNAAIGTLGVDWHNQDPQLHTYISDDINVLCITAERNPTNRSLTVWLNGVKQSEGTGGTGAIAYNTMALGSVNGSGFSGWIAEVMKYGRILTQEEIEGISAWAAQEYAYPYTFSDLPTRRLYARWRAGELTYEDDGASDASEDTDVVAVWGDVSGKGKSWAQTNNSRRPVYDADGLNGRPCLVFNGSKDMTRSLLAAGSNMTWYFVIQPAAATVTGLIDSCPNNGQSFRNHGSDSNSLAMTLGSDPIVQVGMNTDPHILTVIFDHGPNNRITCRLDGVEIGTDSAGSATGVNWGGAAIGSINGGASYDGKLAEIIAYDDAQTEEEIDQTEAALAAYYTIALG